MTRKNRYPFASLCFLLLAIMFCSCSGDPTTSGNPAQSTTTTAPTATPTPIPPVETNCPTNSIARAAVMIPLPKSDHQSVLYIYDHQGDNNAEVSTLKRYDVTTGEKAEVLQLSLPANAQNNKISKAINQPFISPDGQWIVFQTAVQDKLAWQMVRADGKMLQTLACDVPNGFTESSPALSPDQKYLVFPGQKVVILDLTTGQTHIVAQFPDKFPEGYDLIKWRTSTSLYLNDSRIGVGNTKNRHKGQYILLDVTKDASQQNTNLQQVSIPTIAGGSGDFCKDFDFSPDTKQVLASDCTPANDPTRLFTAGGPSTIEIQPVTGGTPQIVHQDAAYAIQSARYISNSTIVFLIDMFAPAGKDTSHNGLWQINIDGSGLKQLTPDIFDFDNFSYAINKNFSEDGKWLAYTKIEEVANKETYSLYYVSMDGGTPKSFASADSGVWGPSVTLLGWSAI